MERREESMYRVQRVLVQRELKGRGVHAGQLVGEEPRFSAPTEAPGMARGGTLAAGPRPLALRRPALGLQATFSA